MRKEFSLKEKKIFEKVIKNGKRIYFNELTLFYLPCDSFKLGISIPKKLGNAVLRNKNKRQIKNIINEYNYVLTKKQVVLIVNKNFIEKNYDEKKKIILNAMSKLLEK